MVESKEGNSNWLVTVLALAVLALAFLWFFSGDDEVSSAPDLGSQLTREAPRGASPTGPGDRAANKTGRAIAADAAGDAPIAVVEVVEEGAAIVPAGSAREAADGPAAVLSEGDRPEGPPSDASYFGLELEPEPGPVELERLAREAAEVPSEAEIQRLRDDEAVREPTQEEVEWMREQAAAVKEPPADVIAQMRIQAEIGPTEEDLERIRLQEEQLPQLQP